jgi:hypothetical protein
VTVTTEATGSQPELAGNLPRPRETGLPAWAQQPAPGTGAPATVYRAPDLADQARRRRSERMARRYRVTARILRETRVPHPDGGERSVAGILRDEEEQRAKIVRETGRGTRKHHRLTGWMRRIPGFVLVFDFCLLLYFFAGITNVDWGSPLSIALAFAIALTAMVTVLSYGFLTFTGHRMRSHKDDTGAIHLDELDGFTTTALGIAIAVIAVLAALMFVRMHTEVAYALGAQAGMTDVVIPLAVTVVSAVANLLVVEVHARDGSDETARLDALGKAARRLARKAHRLEELAAQQANR